MRKAISAAALLVFGVLPVLADQASCDYARSKANPDNFSAKKAAAQTSAYGNNADHVATVARYNAMKAGLTQQQKQAVESRLNSAASELDTQYEAMNEGNAKYALGEDEWENSDFWYGVPDYALSQEDAVDAYAKFNTAVTYFDLSLAAGGRCYGFLVEANALMDGY